MHDLLIAVLIAVIVAIQIAVAIYTYKKIRLFRQTIPTDDSFETVKVYIRESQIKHVSIHEIMLNINKFSMRPEHNEVLSVEAEDESDNVPLPFVEALHNESDLSNLFDNGYEGGLSETEGEDNRMVWITKDSVEQKVPWGAYKIMEKNGWELID